MNDSTVAASSRFDILTVCTGNICRSPLAEHLLRQGFQRLEGVAIRSAGTDALVGEGMTDQTLAIALANGATSPEQHRARALDGEHLRGSSLVIALTRAHRSEIVAMLPRSSRRTFTLRELARLLETVQPSNLSAVAALSLANISGRFTELVDIAAGLRGYIPPPEHEIDDDVIDPYRKSDDVYALMESQLVPAVDTIVNRFELAATITPDRV